ELAPLGAALGELPCHLAHVREASVARAMYIPMAGLLPGILTSDLKRRDFIMLLGGAANGTDLLQRGRHGNAELISPTFRVRYDGGVQFDAVSELCLSPRVRRIAGHAHGRNFWSRFAGAAGLRQPARLPLECGDPCERLGVDHLNENG